MKNTISFLTIILLLATSFSFAQESDSVKIIQLEERIKKLEDKIEQDELEKLLIEAETVPCKL